MKKKTYLTKHNSFWTRWMRETPWTYTDHIRRWIRNRSDRVAKMKRSEVDIGTDD